MKDCEGNKLELGHRVWVHNILIRENLPSRKRVWTAYTGGFPKLCIYIGYRTIYEGTVRGGIYADDPPYLCKSASKVVYVVVEAENKKPFYTSKLRGDE